jgi:lipopolysaccharide/colanic/teichoic acid biosynthesis glycosyltransferase
MRNNRAHVTVVRVPARAAKSVTPWCNSAGKRICDLFLATVFIVVLLLPILLIAVVVKLTSRGPILFRQRRPGRGGREFVILKFRTMVVSDGASGPMLTRAQDPRLTWMGRHLRKWKLDELPQLFNVLRGEMSFVGPRPQPSRLWKEAAIRDLAAVVLSVRPGITSEATLKFRNEESVLARLSMEEVEEVYLRRLMPIKLRIEKQYLAGATFFSDCKILLRTVSRILVSERPDDDLLAALPAPARAAKPPVSARTLAEEP